MLLPLERRIGSMSFLFISELLPRQLHPNKRATLHEIFRKKTKHVPAAVQRRNSSSRTVLYYIDEQHSSMSKSINLPLGAGMRGWPADVIPVEVFNAITSYLPRDSVQAMRLVNAEFERKTSNKLFHTVVVPFRTEIYGMMTHKDEQEPSPSQKRKDKGKGKAKAGSEMTDDHDKTVHDGMKVFEAWGPHIKRFAMAFEVDEQTLESAPKKGKLEQHTTWWGGYQWPHPHYNRYEICECLEKKADEFKCMSKALSYLRETKELGLSLDSGLGWLSGPDKSDRARLFEKKHKVFGREHLLPDAKQVESQDIWDALVDSASQTDILSTYRSAGECIEMEVKVRDGQFQRMIPRSAGTHIQPIVFEGVNVLARSPNLGPEDQGRYMVEGLAALAKVDGHFSKATLKPRHLTLAQQEWLLETEWAQRAFLSSFCMALSDNSHTFRYVHTLNIAKLSSRYLSALQRDDVWSALPNLNKLLLYVSPDWRNVYKTDIGLVEVSDIQPSTAATQLHTLLETCIANVRSIRRLVIGYVGGGEHQTGVFGRNKMILPAPLMAYPDPGRILQPLGKVLRLPFVEDITLENCWIMPNLLKMFASQLTISNCRRLELKSVSLTANTNPLQQGVATIRPSEGSYDTAQGPPLHGNASVGDFFSTRGGSVPDPNPTGWITNGHRPGSWGDVINTITPGPTMDFIRFAFQYRDEAPPLRNRRFEEISFESCGYIRLPNFSDFRQEGIGKIVDHLPSYLISRGVDLYPVMMARPTDQLLGQIVPSLDGAEKEVLTSAFSMQLGWGSDKRSLENREDGQPRGGDGRFGGKIERLVVPGS